MYDRSIIFTEPESRLGFLDSPFKGREIIRASNAAAIRSLSSSLSKRQMIRDLVCPNRCETHNDSFVPIKMNTL